MRFNPLALSRLVPRARPLPCQFGKVQRLNYSLKANRENKANDLLFTLRDSAHNQPQPLSISKFWLRDNCPCSSCMNVATKQRDLDTFKIPANIEAVDVAEDGNGIHITWSDGHKSQYDRTWLSEARSMPDYQAETRSKLLWSQAGINAERPTVKFSNVMEESSGREDQGMAALMSNIKYGLSFVTDTPVTPEATEALLSKIGPIRHTHYGGFYDFTPDMAKADTAYTNIALPAHTDNTYFTDPAGLQAFHMLSHIAPKGSDPAGGNLGGQSLLVDGFHAAEVMRTQHPEAFEVLCSTGIPWHASGNEGIVIIPDRNYPVIELAEGSESTISRIRWNNADRGAIPHASSKQVNEWYDAARLFDGLLRHPDNEFWFQLQPGTVLIFDNWRVLHGRSEFQGIRRMCGGYINRDDYVSRWKTSTRK